MLAKFGPPPLWAREPGFPTLLHIILEQQVSLASALAVFGRLGEVARPFTPERFLLLDDVTLKRVGFSRQKMRYSRALAEAVGSGRLDLEGLESLEDDAARAELVTLPGIGPWTANIYLLMALRRPDVWPVGDLALVKGVQRLKGLREKPDEASLKRLTDTWRPYRAVAARLVWHLYLQK